MAPLLGYTLFALLAFCFTLEPVQAEGNELHRQKRDWIRYPRPLKENNDYTGIEIARIRSDKENFTKIIYSLSGPGVDMPPVNRFWIDPATGSVKVNTILDREEIAFYDLKGMAKLMDGTTAEKDLDLRIAVLDENDCIPVIKAAQVGSVNESSAIGTVVMKVIATDADDENSINSKIAYRIVETRSSAGMFSINSQSGEVSVQRNTLDREAKDTYKVIISASDLNGQPRGNTGTGAIEIKILDINDNVPTLEKESYEGSVEENTINVEVMRIKAVDLDLIYTDNWLAVFEIISGNEGGYFTITTDPKTNEGRVMILRELDYEEIKTLNLEVVVSNKAKYNFGSTSTGSITVKSYPVKINVVNQKEGPRFQPTVKVVTLSEDHTSIHINKVITTYAAIDSDTLQIATNVRYAKIRDDDNWLIIDEKTAEIRLNKLPDRESKFLINGTYYAKIICISNELHSKTATGTIAIQVEDYNDHCPKVTATSHTMCYGDNVIYVTAVDKDEFPNSSPFEFTVISGNGKGRWTVEHLNGTTALLRDQAFLWPGFYQVAVEVKDQQGKSCADIQMLDITVCTCHESTKTCLDRSTKHSSFSVAGILLLLLGLLLLLLVPLLLMFCLCGGAGGDFKAIPFDTKQQLISYHTEGQGEDRDVPLIHTPDGGTVTITKDINTYEGKGYLGGLAELGGAAGGAVALNAHNNSFLTSENVHQYNEYSQSNGQARMGYIDGGMMTGQEQYRGGPYDGLALSDHFLEEYYSSKASYAAQQSQQKDAVLVYDYEGKESLAGSVGCCSLLENDNDLSFLDDLGPKFKTLAEICQGSTVMVECGKDAVFPPPARPVSPVRPSLDTHVHTHTETIKGRDRVHIDGISTSNVTSGMSTLVQEGQMSSTGQGSATLSRVHVQDNIFIPNQPLVMQQPALYYAATPMYVVEPKPQMVLVAGQQGIGQAGQVGLTQSLVQVSGLQGSQGMVLVDGQAGQVAQGTLPRQVLLVESGSSGEGTQVAIVQTGQVSSQQGLEVRGQSVQAKSFSLASQDSRGSKEDFVLKATPKSQGSQRVVVQRKKVSVTERNIESSSRA
ncbi:desmoglein-2-like protein [Dunckerocampus dactyliophorus]|uniref:desmoglein-2-like protein n=1 Tax=Dunckerocampus dactyliophorus TaxID=161453 RepID=UPI0024067BEB|nr:desmoglein-2-like protein [Dunckerocampus dactyliophorus]